MRPYLYLLACFYMHDKIQTQQARPYIPTSGVQRATQGFKESSKQDQERSAGTTSPLVWWERRILQLAPQANWRVVMHYQDLFAYKTMANGSHSRY